MIENEKTLIKIGNELFKRLRCPTCKSDLKFSSGNLKCPDILCKKEYPVINGVPILINESNSLFSIGQYEADSEVYFKKSSGVKSLITSIIPATSTNLSAARCFAKLAKLIIQLNTKPKVLVVGCGLRGEGINALLKENIELLESDVSMTPFTQMIMDSHDIPFKDETFDGVVIQAVLEHVIDPYRCVEEIRRVLKKDGLVYAEIPFMQQVHGRQYDFTRFTYLGLRRLFNKFEEIEMGGCAGPGTSLTWSIRYFWQSFSTAKIWRNSVVLMTALLLWPLKYLDYFFEKRPGALDAASCLYFLGKKSDKVLLDKDLIKLYKS